MAIPLTDVPVSKANIIIRLAMMSPAIRRTVDSVSAVHSRVPSDKHLGKVVVMVMRLIDDKVTMSTITNVPGAHLEPNPVGLAGNSVAFPVHTEGFAILVSVARPPMASAVAQILKHPASVCTTTVEVCTSNLVDGHSIVHVVVRMGEVPASIAPGLTTIVLVVRVVQHWDHVVLLACDIRVHTGGNTPERHTHQSFAAYPHCLTGAVGVAILIIAIAPTVRAASVVQRPAPVRGVEEGTLHQMKRNSVMTIMMGMGEMPSTCHQDAVAILVV